MPTGATDQEPLQAALRALRDLVSQTTFSLAVAETAEVASAAAAASESWAVQRQLEDYVLPRLDRLDAPMLVVVGGSTGAGKSTLVNSLVGAAVTRAGVLRPTTRAPVLVHHPDDAAAFDGDRVLRDLARVRSDVRGQAGTESSHEVALVADAALPQGMALVDAPDIDSVVRENRALADQLMAAADLWLFVTSAARYADAVPWQVLDHAAARGAAVAVVLNRVTAGTENIVRPDLARMLRSRGLPDAPLFLVPEVVLHDGRLMGDEVELLRSWLAALAADAETRAWVVRTTLAGAISDTGRRADGLAAALDEQERVRDRLAGAVRRRYGEASERFVVAATDGTLLRGEVLARWRELVGAGDLGRAVDAFVSRSSERLRAFLWAEPAGQVVAAATSDAIATGLDALLRQAAARAAEATERDWRAEPAGDHLLGDQEMGRLGQDVDARSAAAVRRWQDRVLELVGEVGPARRGSARAIAFGVNGLGVALMMLTFASTGGVTGAELGIAAGTAVVAQRLLEAVFGDQTVRRLTAAASEELAAAADAFLAEEAARFDDLLSLVPSVADQGSAVRTAAMAVRAEMAALEVGTVGGQP